MAQVCAFNICPAFQSSDVSLILGLRSDPYFLSLQSVANSVSVRFASGVHDFSPAFVLLASDFLTLQNFNPCFFAGLDHIDGVGSSVFAASIGGYLKQPACAIGEHFGS